MSREISQELVDRMVALVRDMDRQVDRLPEGGTVMLEFPLTAEPWSEAVAIASLLPKLIDSDLVEARRIAIGALNGAARPDDVNNGDWDSHASVEAALAGIKRGRELAAKS